MTDSYRTSFFALTDGGDPSDELSIAKVEIPLFQRDYAQGRQDNRVQRIRADFLDTLHAAVVGEAAEAVGLDFVYGGVDAGTLKPLDGQQRLTTLFLLHWYLASRAGLVGEDHGWKKFSYSTRQSARMFCQSLVEHPLPEGVVPSEWIKDQPWYLFLWRHDPTIQSMIVVLDAIHDRFLDVDAAAAWTRLTDPESPAVWFLLLPLSGLGTNSGVDMRPEELYIKMNSRGKPLTEFETFKAHFEQTIQWSSRSAQFALNVDTRWSDLLWRLRGDDDVIDDEFMRYLEFVTEICEWRDGRTDGAGQLLEPRTQAIFGRGNPTRETHLEFLFQALDAWDGNSETCDRFFCDAETADADAGRVPLFFRNSGDSEEAQSLFEACCRSYGETRGRTRSFSLGQSLVLYAVLLHLIEHTPEFLRRIRILRNLVEASVDELRPERMPKMLEDVHQVIRQGAVEKVASLNQAQAEDEGTKLAFLDSNPELSRALFALEDHELLRGSICAFELDPAAFEARAATFRGLMSQPELWPDLLAALLAVGEYQRRRTNSRPFLFGTDSKRHSAAWRELLTGPRRDLLRQTRMVLAEFLDRLTAASPPATLSSEMKSIVDEYLAKCEAQSRFDWRYYMVKYPNMRGDGSSTYFAEPTDGADEARMGYSLCVLRVGRISLGSLYRDPYLLAIRDELDDPSLVEDKWFSGYESEPRRLPLSLSGAAIRCVPAGFELTPPPDATLAELFSAVCAEMDLSAKNLIGVSQVLADDGRLVDTVDRIQVGADTVRALAAAGL
jgi:hypothetical protein